MAHVLFPRKTMILKLFLKTNFKASNNTIPPLLCKVDNLLKKGCILHT